MLKNSLIFIAFFLLTADAFHTRRIVGGGNALPGELPHQASIRFWATNFHFAGGSLITNRWVVTSAENLVGRANNSINIVVGTTSLTANVINYRSDRIVVHEAFNSNNNLNNIALIRSSVTIPLTIFVQPIALGLTLIQPGTEVRVSGWGATQPNKGPDSNILQAINIVTANCAVNGTFQTQAQHLCAPAALCTSDLGGPMISNNQLVGVSSWHDPLVCGASGAQDVYARISVFRNWILGNID